MKNYRTSDFDQVPSRQVNKSTFDLSREFKTQICFGRYYPIHWEECYPGDEFFIDWELMARFPGLYLPIAQHVTYRCDVFYLPYSSMWRGEEIAGNDNQFGWKQFIMGQSGSTIPQVRLNINGSKPSGFESFYPGCSYPIENYMGFPFDKTGRLDADKQWYISGNAFPLAMYLACYDQAYRNPLWEDTHFFLLRADDTNQTLFDDVRQTIDGIEYLNWTPQDTSAGADTFIQHPAFFAHYMKDYFTASRPSPQEGDPLKIPNPEYPVTPGHVKNLDGTIHPNTSLISAATTAELQEAGGTPVYIEQDTADIVKLRKNMILQAFHELVARIGTRYDEWVKGIHGNHPEPGIIDVPALVGSWFGRVQISDTVTTAETSQAQTGTYRGNMNSYDQGQQHKYFCQDYGIMMWIVNVMPNTSYSQGIERKWSREIAEDYPLAQLSGIGDQEIKRKELLALNIKAIWDDTDEPYNETIGYNDRFADSKTAINRYFSTNSQYDSWYMGQRIDVVEADYDKVGAGKILVGASYANNNGIREVDIFSSLPIKVGNSTYIDATMFCHFWLGIKVQRCLPFFSTPGKIVY